MSIRDVRWPAAIVGAVLAEAAQIAAAFGWVAFYSYALNPGQAIEVYQQHAQDSGPWVSIVAGFFIFYAVSRWIARSVATALALFVVFVLIDVTLLVLMGATLSIELLAMTIASFSTKLAACYLGGHHAAQRAPA